MQWEPNDNAWKSYIKLEERYNELDRVSEIYERWIGCRPIPKNWVTWAKFEEDRGKAGAYHVSCWPLLRGKAGPLR